MTINILKEPRGSVYRDIVEIAFRHCQHFLLVKQEQLQFNETCEQLLSLLRPSLQDVYIKSDWPGTKLVGKKAEIFTCHLNSDSKKVILESVDGLYDWISPNLPEDLTFLKNGKPWLITVSHEKDGWFSLDTEAELAEIREFQKLNVRTE